MQSGIKRVGTGLVLVAATASLFVTGLVAPQVAAAATPPPNDAFAAASMLGGSLPVTVAGTNADATSEPSEPLDGGVFGGSVWYRWTATSGARVLIETCSTSFDPHLGVYVGPTVDAQAQVVAGERPFGYPCGQRTAVTFVPTQGTTYNLAVRGYDGGSGSFDLTVRQPAATNDDFAAAEVLSPTLPVSATATNAEATKELGEPSHAGDVGGRSLWYSWTPAASGDVAISTCGSNFDTLLAVYTGLAVDALTHVTANDDDPDHCGTGAQSRVVVAATAGTTYMIAVDGWRGSFGSVALSVKSPHPANDDFGAAEPLSGALPITASGSNVSATLQPGEPIAGPGDGASVWFDWTPDENVLVSATTCDSTFATSVTVFTGSALEELSGVGGSGSRCGARGAATFAASAGTSYHLQVVGFGGATGSFTLRIAPADPPVNDAFADATALSGSSLPITVAGTNVDATHEAGEQSIDPAFTASVWFEWTPTENALVQISTCGGDGQSVLGVYTGQSVETLTAVVVNAFGCRFGSTVTLDAQAAQTYWIAVDGYVEGAFDLTIVAATRPVNDAFANATIIEAALPAAIDGSNVAATAEPGEPRHANNDGGVSVWYRWTPDVSTQVTVDTCASDFDTMLAVYTGSAVDDLTAIRSNDDRCGRQSQVTFQAVAGTGYAIAVDGWHGAQGPIHLSLVATNRPPNDDFADAQVVSGVPPITGIQGTNVDASLEPGEPTDGNGGSSSVWYRYSPEESGSYTFASCASDFPLDIDVYTGDQVFSLSRVPSQPASYDCGSDQDVVQLTAGTTYSISVDGRYGGTGDFRFGIFRNHPPANDDFANAQVLQGSLPLHLSGTTDDATTEPGEPLHSGDPSDGASVWFSWTPGATSWVAVDGDSLCSIGASFQQYVVYTGSSVDSLTPLPGRACDGDGTIHFEARGGTTYHIAVQSRLGIAIDYSLTVRALDRPSNDDLARATVVRGPLPQSIVGDLFDGTLEPGEPHASTPPTVTTIWYAWTAAAAGPMTIESCGSAFTTHLRVFSGSRVDQLTTVATENHTCGLNGATTFSAIRGATYRIQVLGRWYHQGPIRLTFRVPQRPANDTFGGARPLSGADPIVVRDSNIDATREPGEPLHAGQGGGSSLWYRWTAPTAGEYRINTCDSGVFGTQLAVYTGTRIDALTTVAADASHCPDGRHGEVTFTAAAGTTYLLAVDSDEGEQGALELQVRHSRRTANDDFVHAQVVAGALPITVSGSSLDATPETGEPRTFNGGYDSNESAVWYRWTAPASGRVSVESCGSGFDSQVGVWTGATLAGLAMQPTTDSPCPAGRRESFNAAAGRTYQIAIDGYRFTSTSTGAVRLTIRSTQRPANDDFDDAVVLAGSLPISVAGNNQDATAEPDEPKAQVLGGAARATVWYTWTAAADGPVVFDACDSDLHLMLGVWVGTSLDQLSRRPEELRFQAGTCQQRRLELAVQAGTTYRISVDGFSGNQGDFDLTIRRPHRPANDDFAAAQPLDGRLPIIVTADETDATAQEPAESALTTSVWYRWTAQTARPVVVDGCDPAHPTYPHVFTGTAIDSLHEVTATRFCIGNAVTFTPAPGMTYWISMGVAPESIPYPAFSADPWENALPLPFQIREVRRPANDDFRQAQEIRLGTSGSTTMSGDAEDATVERGEPQHGGGQPISSVWYRFTPTRSGTVTIDTCGSPDTHIVAAYTGANLADLLRITDGGTGGAGSCGFGIRGTKIAFNGRAGVTYYVAVSGGDTPFHLTVQ